MFDPFGITTFCDDVRFEQGNKLSLIGCYSGEMQIADTAPTIVPILCGVVNLRLPADKVFKHIKIIATKDESGSITELGTAEIVVDHGNAEKLAPLPDASPNSRQIAVTIPMKWSPVEFRQESFIRVRAYIDGSEIKLGSLKIVFVPPLEEEEER